jgi:hypothetical protein
MVFSCSSFNRLLHVMIGVRDLRSAPPGTSVPTGNHNIQISNSPFELTSPLQATITGFDTLSHELRDQIYVLAFPPVAWLFIEIGLYATGPTGEDVSFHRICSAAPEQEEFTQTYWRLIQTSRVVYGDLVNEFYSYATFKFNTGDWNLEHPSRSPYSATAMLPAPLKRESFKQIRYIEAGVNVRHQRWTSRWCIGAFLSAG